MTNRYPTPKYRRTALAPAIVAAIVLLAGLALLQDPSVFFYFRVVIDVLAAIMCVYAFQAKHWWWLPVFAAIVVVWNPLWIIPIPDNKVWQVLQFVATILFLVAGALIRIPNPEDRNARIRR